MTIKRVVSLSIMRAKNSQLIISILVIIPVAICYGILPDRAFPGLFHLSIETTDLQHIFRAMMGLYLGMVAIWVVGIIKPRFWSVATITNVFFMGGLALGRLISLAADGFPSAVFSVGLIVEVTLTIWGIRNLIKYGLT
jgi:hypothetical protein